MKSSLTPEKPLLVYPSLAATLGLDESVMLSALSDLVNYAQSTPNNGYSWYNLERNLLESALPFWDVRDLQRISASLRDKGVIIISSAPLTEDTRFKFAFNEAINPQASPNRQKQHKTQHQPQAHSQPQARPHTHIRHEANAQPKGKSYIAANWQPDRDTYTLLTRQNIPEAFALQQVPEFVAYWRNRNETHFSWDQKFISWTMPKWRNFEEQAARQQKASLIPSHWQPHQNTVDDLVKRKIPKQFILDQIREFISYWQATGENHIAWDSKFIQRVQSLWAERESKRNVSHEQIRLSDNWRPSKDALDVMTQKSEIPLSFIEDAIPEFIIYWQEKGTRSNTWNSLFIKHVRLQWHRFQHSLENDSEASPIPQDWQPARDVFDILQMANIDANFARSLIPEFILYWRDRNELHRSWNSKFLQHVKRTWAARHQQTIDTISNDIRSTRNISLEEELSDTSWAN